MKTGRKAGRKKIDRRECRKHADPGLRMRRDSGLLCAGQLDYIVRTAVKAIGHVRLLVLYVYSREEAAGGTFRPAFTVFQGKNDFATLARREDGSLAWRKAPFEGLGGYGRFQARCALYTPKDEERMWRFCGGGCTGGFEPLLSLQRRICQERRMERQREQERKVLKRMESLPALPRGLQGWAHRSIMPAYFFYDYQKGAKEARGICSSCGKEVTVSGARHNAKGVCPGCGREVTMKTRGRRGRMYDRSTLQVLQRTGQGEAVVRILKCCCAYRGQDMPEMSLWESARFFVRLDGDGVECDSYYDSYHTYGLTGWKKGSRPMRCYYQYSFEADVHGWLYGGNLPDALRGTPWQYCQIKEYCGHRGEPLDAVPFLAAHVRHPRLEHLVKMGFWELASGLAYGCSSGLLDEGQDRTHRVLRVGAEDVAFLRRLDPLPSELEVFQGYCRQNLKGRQELLLWQREGKAWRDVPWLLGYMTPHKMMRYLEGQHQSLCLRRTERGGMRYGSMQDVASEYRDYLRMCAEQGYDMKNSFVLYPKDLQESHDREARRIRLKEDAKTRRAFKAVCRKLKGKMGFEMDGMKVMVPLVPKDLVSEGHALHHCVGSYVGCMAKGECAILFLRRCAEEGKPFYTIEVRDGEVAQVRGMRNCGPTPEVSRFMKRWKEEVLEAPAMEMAA